ncbi:hypothetical protein LCGC14_1995940, partial [marine sediment metagenome]
IGSDPVGGDGHKDIGAQVLVLEHLHLIEEGDEPVDPHGDPRHGGRLTPEAAPARPARAPEPAKPEPTPTERGGVRQRVADVIDPARRTELEEAYRDPMTGLANQTAFQQARPRIEQDPTIEIAALDVQNLKGLNEIEGREVADSFLSEVGRVTQEVATERGLSARDLFRAGGDEFAIAGPKGEVGAAASAVVARIGQRAIGDTELQAGLRMGVGDTWYAAEEAVETAKGTETGPRFRPSEWKAPEGIVRAPTASLRMDPVRFQFKQLGTEGISRELEDVPFSEQLAGVVSVWRDPADGETYVVNGHHRVELAQRRDVKELNVQFIEAETAEEARAIGAFMNIAEGKGTPVDVAKFLRDQEATLADLAEQGVSIRGQLARKGVALSRLTPDIFNEVAAGKVSERWGVAIGEVLEDPALQREALKAVRGSRLSEPEVREVARQVQAAGTEEVTQETLFGTETDTESLFVQRAQIATALKRKIAQDRRLFGFVSRAGRAEELGRAGETTIDVDAAKGLAETSATAEEVFGRLYTRSGPVASLVTEAARRIVHGETVKAVVADIYDEVGEALQAEAAVATGPMREGTPQVAAGEGLETGVGVSGRIEGAPTEEVGPTEIEQETAGQEGLFWQPESVAPLGVLDLTDQQAVRAASSKELMRRREGLVEFFEGPEGGETPAFTLAGKTGAERSVRIIDTELRRRTLETSRELAKTPEAPTGEAAPEAPVPTKPAPPAGAAALPSGTGLS